MSDTGERYAQQIEAARLAAGQGDRTTAVETLSAVVDATSNSPSLLREHGAALNELSRLLVRQGEYARAEPLLKRLLLLARAKGDRHPDVATALAGIAVAKRGLGHHGAAELLYRNALQIREESLAPDHMAIVVTLEQLAETCAARGSFAEALVHLQRALLRRERSLGSEHASVQGLRARIAGLERRAIESTTKTAAPNPIPAPAPAQAPAPTPTLAPAPTLAATPTLPPTPRREPVAPVRVADAPAPTSPIARATAEWRAKQAEVRSEVSAASQGRRSGELAFLYVPEPATPEPAAPPRDLAPTSTSFAVAASGSPAPAHLPVAEAPIVAPVPRDFPAASSRTRTSRYAIAAAALIVLAVSGFAVSSRGSDAGEYTPTLTGADAHGAVVSQASMASVPTTVAPAASDEVRGADAATSAAPGASDAASMAMSTAHAPESEGSAAAPSAPVVLPKLRRLVVPGVAMPSVDSVVMASANLRSDADVAPLGMAGSLRASSASEAAAVTPPVLVYSPALRFPAELREKRVEGEVVVQFRVNEKGRVEPSSMQVVQSAHEMLTEAVRSVLPRFRFQPARSPAPESKPQAAWVQFRAQFNAKN